MKNASQWSAEVKTLKGELRSWDTTSLSRLQNLLEYLIIRSKEETVALAQNPDTRVQKIRLAAGRHSAYEELSRAVRGVINERS